LRGSTWHSLIGAPHLIQGISAVVCRRVQVGVGLNDCSIVSSVSMKRRNATHPESRITMPDSCLN
jgi:hypothetical protein